MTVCFSLNGIVTESLGDGGKSKVDYWENQDPPTVREGKAISYGDTKLYNWLTQFY